MFFDKCKLLRVYDSSLPIRVYFISTSLLKLTSLTTLVDIAWTCQFVLRLRLGKQISMKNFSLTLSTASQTILLINTPTSIM